MTTLPALALVYAGLTALCLAMEKHHRQVLRRAPAHAVTLALRLGGIVALVAALLLCATRFDGSLGFVVWLGLLTAAGLPLVFLFPYAPRAAVAAAACAPLAALLVWAAT